MECGSIPPWPWGTNPSNLVERPFVVNTEWELHLICLLLVRVQLSINLDISSTGRLRTHLTISSHHLTRGSSYGNLFRLLI